MSKKSTTGCGCKIDRLDTEPRLGSGLRADGITTVTTKTPAFGPGNNAPGGVAHQLDLFGLLVKYHANVAAAPAIVASTSFSSVASAN